MAERGASGGIGARRAAMLGGSAALHAALLILLARYLAQTPRYAETPVMQVSLAPAPPRPERVEPPIARAAPAELRGPVGAVSAPPILSSPAMAGDTEALPSGAGGPSDGEAVGEMRQALQALGGCERAGMTREDRERCEARRWSGPAPVMARLNLDPSGRYAKNLDPVLSRRPTKGCRLRATGDAGPFGDSQNARAGITCVKPF